MCERPKPQTHMRNAIVSLACRPMKIGKSSWIALLAALATAISVRASEYDIRDYGAVGDGQTLDTDAINAAINAASAAGGGIVKFPAGVYVSGSIRLKSDITLWLQEGCTLEATSDPTAYDPPEPNVWGDEHEYQDFGHSHWQNSLIWGDGLQNIAIVGRGLIHGKGFSRGLHRRDNEPPEKLQNKAIALKNCRNVTMRDISILRGGHFAIIGTGVDNWTIDNVQIDTQRDGIDIDCCKNVRVSNTIINSPHDDAIVLKSSFGLGYARVTENVAITNCQVSGYNTGTLFGGTRRWLLHSPPADRQHL